MSINRTQTKPRALRTYYCAYRSRHQSTLTLKYFAPVTFFFYNVHTTTTLIIAKSEGIRHQAPPPHPSPNNVPPCLRFHVFNIP